jgi:hypothetical protein
MIDYEVIDQASGAAMARTNLLASGTLTFSWHRA